MDVDVAAEFDELFATVGPRLWRAIVAYSGGRLDIADDVVAEAFVRVLEAGSRVRDPEPYLYRVAFRLAALELRRASTTGAVPDQPIFDDVGLTELFDTLSRLSPKQRAAVYLRYQADMPAEQIACVMGTSVSAVRVHLFRARRRLGSMLGGHND